MRIYSAKADLGISEWILLTRRSLSLTQDELAQKCHVCRWTLIKYEKGQSEAPISFLIELAAIAKVELPNFKRIG
jgi:DNA-binding XRE family transcriptional regulator